MLTKPESLTVSINFETKLECVMNILPDKFQWKFYPLDKKDSFNPKAPLSLTNSKYRIIPADKYEPQKKMSSLTLQVSQLKDKLRIFDLRRLFKLRVISFVVKVRDV